MGLEETTAARIKGRLSVNFVGVSFWELFKGKSVILGELKYQSLIP